MEERVVSKEDEKEKERKGEGGGRRRQEEAGGGVKPGILAPTSGAQSHPRPAGNELKYPQDPLYAKTGLLCERGGPLAQR